MSYQVLARKWRPSNFSQVAGQAHVLKSLINALDNQRLHHAYLFTGTRGVGKTTLARILAKCLNCETGLSSVPCDKCGSCIEINEGRFIDLMEVDAASRTKVEDTRELLDNVQYSPARGRYKVYLIDEVHMLSNHSFNALLKTLEEPPEHVKFLFATTDPHKLPVTILSRCLQFNLKNLSPKVITDYLVMVLEQEKVKFDPEALWQLATAGAGSMRDALTLVDQAISYCQGEITTQGVIEMLGIPQQQQIFALLQAMAAGSAEAVINLVRTLSEQTPDYFHTLDSLLSALHRIAIAQVLPEGIDNSFGDKQQILELATNFSAEDVQLYYQMGLKGREDLGLSGEISAAFEMLILRMMVFSPKYVPLAIDQHGAASAESDLAETDVSSPDADEALDGKKKKLESVEQPHLEEPTPPQPPISGAPIANREQKTSDGHPVPTQQMTHMLWLEYYFELGATGITSNVLANTEFKFADGQGLHFALDKSQSAVFNEDLLPKISQLLSKFFNEELKVFIEIADVENETPASLNQRINQERHIAMVNEFEKDENVQELVRHFSGTVAKESIAAVTNTQLEKD